MQTCIGLKHLVWVCMLYSVLALTGCKSTNVDTAHPDNNGNLLTSLERTGCYGRCPIYKISVYQNGLVYYEATRFTDTTGKFCTVLSKKELGDITASLKSARLFGLEDKYPVSKITPVDLPSCIVIYQENGKQKRIVDRGNSRPDELISVETQIDALVKRGKLQNCDK